MNAIEYGDDAFFARYKVDYIFSSPTFTVPLALQICVSKDAFCFYDAKNIANFILFIPHNKIRCLSFVSGSGLRIARKGFLKNLNNGLTNNVYRNEIQFDYIDHSNQNALLRIGMATSILVAQRAADCQQLDQLLKMHKIYEKFISAQQIAPSVDIMDKIEKLSELHKSGILTDDEFQSKKTALLKQL